MTDNADGVLPGYWLLPSCRDVAYFSSLDEVKIFQLQGELVFPGDYEKSENDLDINET